MDVIVIADHLRGDRIARPEFAMNYEFFQLPFRYYSLPFSTRTALLLYEVAQVPQPNNSACERSARVPKGIWNLTRESAWHSHHLPCLLADFSRRRTSVAR